MFAINNQEFKSEYTEEKSNLTYQIKLDLWQTAFGLQKVDNLTPSEYMVEPLINFFKTVIQYEEYRFTSLRI
ncbi:MULTISPECIES: hypothetical protein [unclassified Facklamia]|uniref:hypothetical protein n=1 Tax=Aerococcaceae TaxID=186827 RepID=UPI0013B80A87|nr:MULTISPECIES: hypothetical protein [unclassified Facklamia]NEW65360.1 hypothetical protein [Facklamia sp. 252]NEW68512.1 hypothetical protein [Facklamia sp. 253]QQD66552.1 hypothetical protein JDW14_06000 [Aerococcaceae bacterium zg-252]